MNPLPSLLHPSVGLGLALGLAVAAQAGAQTTNWIAYNDHNPSAATAPKVTGYNLRGLASNPPQPLEGPLTNYIDGAELTAYLIVTAQANAAGTSPDYFGSISNPDPGTPAYNLFNGLVDLGNVNSAIGVRKSSTTPETWTTLIFTNLSPAKKYVFRGTAVRGNNYLDRWTLCTILGAAAFTDAHSAGVYTSASFPTGTMTPGQASWNSGENRATGAVVGWDDIVPAADGTFSVRSQQYADNPLPNGMAPNLGNYGYAICGFMLAEIETGPPQPPAIDQQPVATTVNERQVASLAVGATGTGLTYQWYVAPATPIPGAISATYTVTNRLGDSRYPWSNPADSGTYFVIVSGTAGAPVESVHVNVTVNADVTAPTLSYAICGPGANEVTLTFSEPMNNEAGDVADQFLWEFRTLDDSEAIQLAGNGVYTDDGRSTTIVFTFDAPGRDPAKSYKLVRASDPGSAVAVDTAKAPNGLARGASIPILCFTNEIFGYTKTWQYNDDDVDPGATWANVGYDDSAAPWATGAAPFDGKLSGSGAAPFQGDANNCRPWTYYDFGNSNVNTCINYRSPVTLTNLHTAYFRTHFSFSGSPAGKYLLLHGKFDDAGVVYLNGTEVGRMRVADAALPHDQYSGGATVGDGDGQDVFPVINSPALASGDNVLAVLLKQVNSTSSDLTMGLALDVLEATPAATRPVLTITYSADHPTISWAPAGGTLQFKHNLSDATWTDIGAATTPYTDLASPGDHGFYQVKTP